MAIDCVFWDSDNTLVDTRLHHWRKHVETLKKHGISLNDCWQDRIYTNNGSQNWDWISAELGLTVSREEYLDEIDAWYYAHIGDINLRAGIEDALTLFERQNLPMAVVSNGRRRSVMAALDAKDLSRRFQFVLCIEDYEGRKPDPAPYLAAKTRMQTVLGRTFRSENCLVIEDDPKGVAAGRAAGMDVIDRPVGNDDIGAFLDLCKNKLARP